MFFKKKKKKGQGTPWEVEGHPLVSEGHFALLKMPRRSTRCAVIE
jgi:hypothetical protein